MSENRLSHQSNPNCNTAVRPSRSETPQKSPYKLCLRAPLLVPVVLFLIAHIIRLELPPPSNQSPFHFLIGSRQTWALFPVMDLFKIQNVGRGVCVCLPAEWCAAYTVTWTPGLNVNWTRFWFKALSNISASCWNTEKKNKKQKQNKTEFVFNIFFSQNVLTQVVHYHLLLLSTAATT